MLTKQLTINDLDLIYELFIEQFKEESWTKEQIISSLMSNSTKFYGIFINNKLVCVASVLITIDDINLLDIATKEEYKRQGLATNLLQYLITLKSDQQTFSLEVKSKNINAINLYKNLGFTTLNIRKKYYKDGDDALCMFLTN